jgi:hypothetical protein
MQRVINFSGGKTSAYMTILIYKPGDIVLFCDTMREHPKTYKFINDFEKNENIPIVRISYAGGFKGLLEKKKYKVIPNRVKRFCTVELKIKTAKRYLRSIGVQKFENFIGFRYDEPNRTKKNYSVKVINKYPLFDEKITKEIINDFWSKKTYNLEIPPILGNCTLCFNKGKNAIISILRNFPELANEWIEDEEKANGYTYFEGNSIKKLKEIAQNNLFKDYHLNDITPAYNCECTNN